jgi:hypothetical protein
VVACETKKVAIFYHILRIFLTSVLLRSEKYAKYGGKRAFLGYVACHPTVYDYKTRFIGANGGRQVAFLLLLPKNKLLDAPRP